MVDFSSFVNELKQRANIVQIVGNYVHLKKVGGRYTGLCPFHGDRNPSMTVSAQIGIFKCFSCGQGGDVIKFVQDYEKIEFMEAIRQIAETIGMDISALKFSKPVSTDNRKIYLELYAKASQYYVKQFRQNQEIRGYLDKRCISSKIIEKFNLGFSSLEWSGLSQYLQSQKYKLEQIISSGLAKKNERSSRDTFVGRLMFPIHNLSHQIVGFGGRIISLEQKIAKYINSAESILYHKSSILYGLNFSRKAIQDANEVVIVEGYMDVLRLFQEGIENVVSVSGTALTEEQIKIISRFAGTAYLFFDGDDAGISAIEKSLPMLLKQGLEVKIPHLPIGDDPDSFALKNGKQALQELFLKSDNILEFLLRDFKKKPLAYTNEQMGRLFEKIKRIFSFIHSDFVRREYLSDLVKIEKEFFAENSVLSAIGTTKVGVKQNLNAPRILTQVTEKIQQLPEWKLLPLVISSNIILEELFDQERFNSDWLEDLFLQEIVERIMVECERMEVVNLKLILNYLPKKFREIIYAIEPLDLNTDDSIILAKKSLFQILKHIQILFLKKKLMYLDLSKSESKLTLEVWKKQRIEIQAQLKKLMSERKNVR